MQEFFLLLAVCNTVIVAKSPHRDSMTASGIVPNSAKIGGGSNISGVSAGREASSPSVANTVSTQLDEVKEERYGDECVIEIFFLDVTGI